MRNEYRNQIDPKYSKKIESIVRKAPKNIKQLNDFDDSSESAERNGFTDDTDQDRDDEIKKSTTKSNDSSPCPICNHSLQNMDVTCAQCKTTLPICIATGQHITDKFDNCICPECQFPSIKSEMIK